jgi:hypothetical protein
MPSGGMLKSVDKAFEDLKKKIKDKLDEILKPLRDKMQEWGLILGKSWDDLIGVITGREKPIAVGIELEGEDKGVSKFEAALKPFGDAWKDFAKFWDENGATVIQALKDIGLEMAKTTGTALGAALIVLAAATKELGEVLVFYGPEISAFFKDMGEQSEASTPKVESFIKQIEKDTIRLIKDLGKSARGEKPFGEVLQDWFFGGYSGMPPEKLALINRDMANIQYAFSFAWLDPWVTEIQGKINAAWDSIFGTTTIEEKLSAFWDKVKASWNAGGEFIEKFWNILTGKNADG